MQVIWFIIGACVGSFLNVCIWRMPRDESLIRPRSHCPSCTHPIAWHDNIPLLSYLLLGGKCRHCKAPIHWRYPLVEMMSGFAAVVVLKPFGAGPVGLVYLGFVWALIAVTFIDLEHQIIPDEISLGGLALGLGFSLFIPQLHNTLESFVAFQRALVGAIVGGGLIFLTGGFGNLMLRGLRLMGVCLRRHQFWRRLLSRYRHAKESMGGGDLKLMAMGGSILGWQAITIAFFLAPFFALGPGIFSLITKRSLYIPYGPFLSMAMLLMLFERARVMQSVLKMLGVS